MSAVDCPHCARTLHLDTLLRADEVDAAIEAGLMTHTTCPLHAIDVEADARITDARLRLRTAWDARERHRQRAARLARRAAEREARRLQPATSAPTQAQPPALPPAAADILARAKAKAAERLKR